MHRIFFVLSFVGLAHVSMAAGPQCPVPGATIVHNGTTVGVLTRHDLTDPKALCNDGSPGAYFMQPGTGQSAHRWVVSLEGGGACTGLNAQGNKVNSACKGRSQLVKVKPLTGPLQGLMSADPQQNPDFWDATKIYMSYCSSDDWTGTNLTPSGPFTLLDYHTWNYAGRYILAAAIQDALQGATVATTPTEVLYTGGSAGAYGVILTVSDVAATLAALPKPPRLVATADAGYVRDAKGFDNNSNTPPYLSTVDRFPKMVAAGASLWLGRGDLNCVNASNHSVQAELNCREPEYVFAHGYIAVPMLLQQSRVDSAFLEGDGVVLAPSGSGGCAAPFTFAPVDAVKGPVYAQYHAGVTQTSLTACALQPNAPRISVFAPDVMIHTEDECGALFNLPRTMASSHGNATLSAATALGAWYRSPCIGENWEEDPGAVGSCTAPP